MSIVSRRLRDIAGTCIGGNVHTFEGVCDEKSEGRMEYWSPRTVMCFVAAPSLAYTPWTMSNTASYFPSVSAIQSKRRKKLSIIVDWDSGRGEDGRKCIGEGAANGKSADDVVWH